MRSGQIYKNKAFPNVKVRILWVSGDNCQFEPLNEEAQKDFDAHDIHEWDCQCTILEFLKLYENDEIEENWDNEG